MFATCVVTTRCLLLHNREQLRRNVGVGTDLETATIRRRTCTTTVEDTLSITRRTFGTIVAIADALIVGVCTIEIA
jgi:hypothetical protein